MSSETDPLAVLQSRLEQMVAKLDVVKNRFNATLMNFMNTAQGINNATAGHEKLTEAMQGVIELNNNTDPNFVEKLRTFISTVLESEAIQQAPQMQAAIDDQIEAAAEKFIAEASEVIDEAVKVNAEAVGESPTVPAGIQYRPVRVS